MTLTRQRFGDPSLRCPDADFSSRAPSGRQASRWRDGGSPPPRTRATRSGAAPWSCAAGPFAASTRTSRPGPATLQVVHQTYNALLKFNHDGTKILPDLAESWEQKDDLTYVFRLRQGVKFHNVPPVNGRELTSEDVKYSIERQMTNQPGKFQHAYFFLGKLASIETPDKYTVVFKTKEPYAPFLNYIASPWTVIVAREVVEKHGDLQRHAIGTGPFIMQEYRRDQEAVFAKNPDYFSKGVPYVDEVRLQYVIDPVAATAAFRGQQTDISLLEFADVASIKTSNAKVKIAEITTMFPIVLRTRPYDDQRPHKPPFNEKKVRQAIQAAIKQEEFIEIVRSGWGMTMTGPIPTYRKPWALPASARPEFDLKKAKRLLGEAGYASGFETELIVGTPGDNVKSAQVVKDQLAKVGIQVNLKPMEMAQYYNKSYTYDYSDERPHCAHRGGAGGGDPPLLRGERHVLPMGQQGDPSADRRAGQDARSEEARGHGASDPADAARRRPQRLPLHADRSLRYAALGEELHGAHQRLRSALRGDLAGRQEGLTSVVGEIPAGSSLPDSVPLRASPVRCCWCRRWRW